MKLCGAASEGSGAGKSPVGHSARILISSGERVGSPNTKKVLAVVAVALAVAMALSAAKKNKNGEDETQALQLPKELPSTVAGETRRLLFYTTPLSAKGLLSQQIKDALKSLERQAGGNTVLQIRAFVAGSGDLRRVRELVSETFTDRRQPLPVLSLIQAGGLPLDGAQVVLEAIAAGKKDLHPGGLAFIPAQAFFSASPLDPVAPLVEQSLTRLRQAVGAAGADASDVLRVTCFLSSLDNIAATRQLVEASYARAALNYMQAQRASMRGMAACEAVAGLRGPPPRTGAESPIAVVTAPHVVLTGTQVSFGYEGSDARLAFERLGKALEPAGSNLHEVAFAHFYPVSQKIEDQIQALRPAFFDAAHPPAASLVQIEGLSSLDAGFAMDVVAAKN
jgi:enamine deaminase RidA (YjgF/YER057c/UK114 family)